MHNTYSAGVVTAYGAAKKAGYTGTYEEFCAEQAQFAQNAQQVREDKESVEQTVETFEETTVPAAVQAVTDAGTTQVGRVNQAGSSQVESIGEAGTTQVGNVNQAGSTQVAAVNQAGATQVQAVEDKGDEVIESIPADYTQLSEDVDELKNALIDKVSAEQMQKCELVEVPTSANLWDNSSTSTGLLHTNGQVYTGGSYDNYCYYDIGEVAQGDVLTSYIVQNGVVSAEPMQRVVAYDENGSVMASSGAVAVNTFTVPSGVARLSVTMTKAYSAKNFMVLKNASAPTEYIPYFESYSYYMGTKEFLPTDFFDGFVERNGEKQVTAKNAEFMFYSPNLIDESTLIDGYYVNQGTGALEEASVHAVTDWINVDGGQTYTLSSANARAWRYCFYDAAKTFIRGAYVDTTLEVSLLAPSNAKFFRCSTSGFRFGIAQFEKGSKTPYSVYGTAYLLEQYAPKSDHAVINLPKKIYALTGYELNIYFENLTEDWTRYAWNVDCTKGMQLERGYRVTPTNSDAGSYTLTITATDSTGTVTTATTTLIITASSAGSGVADTLIVLGDSTTNSGIAVTKLAQNFADDVMSLTLYGTRGTAPYKHEGRSGWTFNAYFNPPNAGDIALGVENPWYNPITEAFDASYYFANSGVSVPDWFFINLGINDTFSYTSDSSLETAISTIKGLCDSMISSLKSAAPNMKIGLCLTIPPNDSQDAFGKAYNCGQTRDRYKRNNVLWVNSLIEEYDNREAENLYLVPIYTNLDTVWNMGMETLPVNARNTATTYQSPIANGGVHPVESGYWQIADVYTAFLKAQASS